MAVIGAPPAAAAPSLHRQRSTPPPAAGTFVPISRFRALDTGRSGGPVRAGHRVTITLGGRHGIPAGAAAVAVTLHAVDPTTDGTLTAFPARTTATATTALTYHRGRTTAEAAVVRLAHGAFTVLDRARRGTTQLAVDVAGYWTGGRVGSGPGLLHLLRSPVRALDTRRAGGYLRPHAVRSLRVGHGVPSSGVGAVAVELTALDPAGAGSLVAYATGNDRPSTPTTHFDTRRTTTSFAWVPTRADGSITVANTSTRGTGALLDVVGWTAAGVARTAGALEPRFPDRLASGIGLGAGRSRTVSIAGRGGVPRSGVRAVVAMITASSARRSGALLVGGARSTAARRAVEFEPGGTATDVVELPLTRGGLSLLDRSAGPVTIALDVLGFVPSRTLTAPRASVSRYLGDLTENITQDQTVMDGHGCTDAQAVAGIAHPFVLLDVGAQSVTGPELSATDPGVSLAETARTERLTYPQLVTVLDSYLAAFERCAPGSSATVAIGTNNDGQWTATLPDYYAPDTRGADWAGKVVAMLSPPAGLTVVGADDIEPDFASTQAQARAWEDAYLASAGITALVDNGSADGCPDGFGRPGAQCSSGYTEQGLYDLAHTPQDPTDRIEALPQIYSPSMAAQWANIDATGGGHLALAGVLTEHALAPGTYLSADASAALYYALGSVTAAPGIPAATDLTNG